MSSVKCIQNRMKELNLSCKQIAWHIKLSEKVVSAYIEGIKKIPYKHLWMICDLLNLDMEDLL